MIFLSKYAKRYIKAFQVVLILFLVIFSNGKSVAQSVTVKEFPEKIISPGLTLSGGGAKGLAHIGVIHILDSLGIKVRYISGTSMGSIIGGMYASGYSAKEIEAFATGIDWETLFAAKASLNYLPPQERSNSGKNIVELSIEKGKIKLPTGAIEGQQLWNTLNEIFLRVYQVSDFEQLPIPFACVATDVENGTPVVMKTGNLSSAVRASMAIPSVFTAVIRDEKKLIDGGVVRNFPVSVVRDLGADFVIGVNVSQGLRRSEELRTPVDIIYQMGFYLDAQNFISDQKLTDIYIEPDLTGFIAASFSNAQEIIERGKIAARSKMKSLQLLAGKLQTSTPGHADSASGRKNEFYVTDTILISGNKKNSNHYIKSKLGIVPGDTLYPEDFTAAVNRLYASTGFERINYFLSSSAKQGKVILNIDVIEKPHAKILAGINYSTFNGIGIIAGVQTNRFIFNNTHAFGKILIGKNPAFRTGITFYPGIKRYNWLNIEAYGMQLKFPVYDNFKPVYEYSQTRTQINLSANKVTGKNSYVAIGTSLFFHELKPKIISEQTVKGSNSGFETFLKWNYHTLNRNSFPLSGQNICLQASLFHGQNPHFKATSYNGETISLNELKITIDDFLQTHMIWETFLPLSRRATQIIRFQTGYNFSYNQSFINSFNLGGTNNFLDKQLVFTGLNDYEIITNSALTGAFGLQYQIGNNVFLTGILNSGMYDFELENLSRTTYSDNVIVGAGLSLGYLSLLGPIELTFSYSPQTEKIIGYINLGWSF